MAYGDRTRNSVRSFGPLSIFGVGLASAFGIGTAVVVDLLQQREASALFVLNRLMMDLTGLLGLNSLPLYAVMLILMAIGGLSIFFLQPQSMRGAYVQGFGLLATVLTIAPSDLGAPLDAPSSQPAMLNNAGLGAVGFEAPRLVETSTAQRGERASATQYQLRLQIEFPEGLSSDWETMLRRRKLTGKLYNPETGVRYDLFRNSGAELRFENDVLRIRTDVRGIDGSADLKLLVEADGYKILEDEFTAQAGPNRIWSVTMEPSNMPLVVQRLRHSYSF